MCSSEFAPKGGPHYSICLSPLRATTSTTTFPLPPTTKHNNFFYALLPLNLPYLKHTLLHPLNNVQLECFDKHVSTRVPSPRRALPFSRGRACWLGPPRSRPQHYICLLERVGRAKQPQVSLFHYRVADANDIELRRRLSSTTTVSVPLELPRQTLSEWYSIVSADVVTDHSQARLLRCPARPRCQFDRSI